MKTNVKIGPRGEARRRAMLDAATELFVEKGFEGTSVTDIIACSGGSRATLYEIFGGKEGLFEAMVEEGCRKVVAPLEAKAIEGRQPKDVLCNFGHHIAEQMMTVESRALTKILAADGHRLPDIVDFFFRHGLDLVRDRLADYLRQASVAGYLAITDADTAASLFLSMVEGDGMIRRIFGASRQMSAEQVRRQIAMATDIFLHGTQKEGSTGSPDVD
ncbi:TetR/AcrR family transcriptional regulator [Shumkonia mesophila]|uniref:TetR/AcrR family transcriptional regulator n=1 Tax=Shumkonia mesophila TaxID=2838854 RepID=UPI0029351CF6|nr:TetR/AcrR family transcriptional regulator [Shumkonia mesophila]